MVAPDPFTSMPTPARFSLLSSVGKAVQIIEPTPGAFGDQPAGSFPFFFGVRVVCLFEGSPVQVIGAQFFSNILPAGSLNSSALKVSPRLADNRARGSRGAPETP